MLTLTHFQWDRNPAAPRKIIIIYLCKKIKDLCSEKCQLKKKKHLGVLKETDVQCILQIHLALRVFVINDQIFIYDVIKIINILWN